jgi:hypothetical protein
MDLHLLEVVSLLHLLDLVNPPHLEEAQPTGLELTLLQLGVLLQKSSEILL